MTAAEYAAILDPEHEIDDWWMYDCPECGASNGHYAACFDKPPHCWTYTGPPDLHIAREHAWRMEEWLEEHDCVWARKYDRNEMINQTQVCLIGKRGKVLLEFWNTNHSVALTMAVEKVVHNCKRKNE